VNTDHFLTKKAYKAHVFNCTKGNGKDHLIPYYDLNSPKLFVIAKEMIDYLKTHYSDCFKVRNACVDYYSLNIKSIEAFVGFYTCFLHLTRHTQIPTDD
jgi:hypothetical protein